MTVTVSHGTSRLTRQSYKILVSHAMTEQMHLVAFARIAMQRRVISRQYRYWQEMFSVFSRLFYDNDDNVDDNSRNFTTLAPASGRRHRSVHLLGLIRPTAWRHRNNTEPACTNVSPALRRTAGGHENDYVETLQCWSKPATITASLIPVDSNCANCDVITATTASSGQLCCDETVQTRYLVTRYPFSHRVSRTV